PPRPLRLPRLHDRRVVAGRVEADGQARARVGRPDHDAVRRRVLDLQVGVRVAHRRLPPVRVARDVERVALVLAELQAGEEGGVERRRRELGDAAADVLGVLAILDHGRGHEPLRRRALADRLVDRERGPGRDHVAAEYVGEAVDVLHPRLTALVTRGEGRYLLVDAAGPGLCLGSLRWTGAKGELDRRRRPAL